MDKKLELLTHESEQRTVATLVGDQVRRNKKSLTELEYQLHEIQVLGLAIEPQTLEEMRQELVEVFRLLRFAVQGSFPCAKEAEALLLQTGSVFELLQDIEMHGVF